MVNNPERPVALITGASGGLGKELAVCFGASGYSLALNYHRNARKAQKLSRRLRDAGVKADVFCADVGDSDQVTRMLDAVQARFGPLDTLVHCAGSIAPSLILRMTSQAFDDIVRTHLKGAFLCTRAAARMMKKRKRGSIVYVGSMIGSRGVAGECNYAAAKAGLVGLAKSAARELGVWNIRVNVVLPGYMRTAMGLEAPPATVRAARQENVLRRWTDPKDSAQMIVAISQAAWISGQVFNLDGRIL